MMNGYTIFFWIFMLLPILIGCGYALWKLFIYYYRVIRGEHVYWDRDFWFHPWRHMDYLDRRNYFIGLIIVTFYYILMSVGLYYSFDYLRESMIQLSWGWVVFYFFVCILGPDMAYTVVLWIGKAFN